MQYHNARQSESLHAESFRVFGNPSKLNEAIRNQAPVKEYNFDNRMKIAVEIGYLSWRNIQKFVIKQM